MRKDMVMSGWMVIIGGMDTDITGFTAAGCTRLVLVFTGFRVTGILAQAAISG
jgi:hypothetical protein